MQRSRRQDWILLGSASLVALAVVLLRLDASGVWDPWELDVAEAARRGLTDGFGELEHPPLSHRLVALGFSLFGTHGWAGRLPIALVGLLSLLATHLLVLRHRDGRAGSLAVLITAIAPLFIFGSRFMFGHAPSVLGQVLIAIGAMGLAFPADENERAGFSTALWLLALLSGAAIGIATAGALRGVLPPLAAVGVAAILGGRVDPRRHPGALLVALGAIAVALGVVDAVARDADLYSHWTGGRPQGGDPPTYEAVMEAAFFGLAPFSALAVVALPSLLLPRPTADEAPDEERRHAFRLFLLLWTAFGYGAETVFASRYGSAPFASFAPVPMAVALFLRDVEEDGRAEWMAAIVSTLFVALLIRDFAVYPASPVAGLGLEALRVPDAFSAKRGWAVVLSIFGAVSLFVLGPAPDSREFSPRAPYRWLRAVAKQGSGAIGWLALTALVLVGLVVFGALCWTLGAGLGIPTLAMRIGKVLLFLPFALPLLILLLQAVLAGASRLGSHRLTPLLLAGVMVGGFAAHGFQVQLSEMLSPRGVYDRYAELRGDGEGPLGEFEAGARATRYYAGSEIESLSTLAEATVFLTDGEQRWLVLPAEKVSELDLSFRRAAGRHLFLPDSPEGRVALVGSHAVPGVPNVNPMEGAILDRAPEMDQGVGAIFEEKVELLGYDIELPEDDYVGGGQSASITWYWRCLAPVGRSYRVFVHIDGDGSRVHGDHDPVGGLYPTNRWQPGEIIADRHEIRVSGAQAPGNYQILVGFYSGQNRLEVETGSQDGENRVRAGVLRIR